MGEENSLDLRHTHGAGRADGRVPLALSAHQDAKRQRGARGGVTFLGYVQVTWACPPTLWKAQQVQCSQDSRDCTVAARRQSVRLFIPTRHNPEHRSNSVHL